MFIPSQKDIDVLYQKNKQLFVKVYLLNRQYQTVDEMQGELISGTVTVDAESDIRRAAHFTFRVKDRTYYANQHSKIWMDKFADLNIGVYYNKTGEILWYPIGLYVFNENGFQYDSVTRTVTCGCVDLMGYFTGLRAGTLRGLKTEITNGMTVTDVVRDTVTQLGGVTNYVVEPNANPDYLTLPYDLDFATGATVYDILRKIADIYPATEFYFDTDRTFRWGYTPTATNDMILLDDDIFHGLIISEGINRKFSDVRNCIEVWGHDDLSARLVLVDELPSEPNPDYNYKADPYSPFTVEKLGEIWEVKSSGEYVHIHTKELALDRAKYELYLSTSAQDTLSLNMILIPFLDVNRKISYRTKSTEQTSQYITKRLSFDIGSATMQAECIRFTPLYSWL